MSKPREFQSVVVIRTETSSLVEQYEHYDRPLNLIEKSAADKLAEALVWAKQLDTKQMLEMDVGTGAHSVAEEIQRRFDIALREYRGGDK